MQHYKPGEKGLRREEDVNTKRKDQCLFLCEKPCNAIYHGAKGTVGIHSQVCRNAPSNTTLAECRLY